MADTPTNGSTPTSFRIADWLSGLANSAMTAIQSYGRKAQIAAAITFALALAALGAWHYGWFNNAVVRENRTTAERVPALATAADVAALNATLAAVNANVVKLQQTVEALGKKPASQAKTEKAQKLKKR